MANKEWASLLAGLVLATAGVTALALADGGPADASVPAPTPTVSAAAEGASGSETAAPAPEAAAARPSGAAAGMGAEVGWLREIDPAAFGIPPQVARVLASRRVVLTVRQTGDAAFVGEGGTR